RRPGPGDDDDRSAATPRTDPAVVGLLQKRPDEDPKIPTPDARRRPARDVPERQDHGKVSPRDAKVLLRSHEVQNVPRTARRQVPNRPPDEHHADVIARVEITRPHTPTPLPGIGERG